MTLNRPSFVINAFIIIIVCLALPAFSDTVYISPFSSAGQSVWISGNALDIDYTVGDFILKDRGRLYIVLAKQATIQLPAGKFDKLSSVKEGCFVRVCGEQLSSQTIYASLVIVMDETAAFQDQRPNSYFIDDNVWIGDVIWVFAFENKFKLRTNFREYVLIVDSDTRLVNGPKYCTGICSIFPTDRLRVVGSIDDGNTIRAKSITVIDSVDSTTIKRLRSDRRDIITGKVISIPSSFGGKLKLITNYGVRDVIINPGSADLKRLRSILEDKRNGLIVRVHGMWQDRILLADRIDVLETAKSEIYSKTK